MGTMCAINKQEEGYEAKTERENKIQEKPVFENRSNDTGGSIDSTEYFAVSSDGMAVTVRGIGGDQ